MRPSCSVSLLFCITIVSIWFTMDFDPHKKANKCEYIGEQARISSVNIPLIRQSSIVNRKDHKIFVFSCDFCESIVIFHFRIERSFFPHDGYINARRINQRLLLVLFALPFLSTCPPSAFPTIPSINLFRSSINLFRSSIYLAHFMYAKNGPRKAVKNFIYIFPHKILIYGIMPVFGQIARKSCREKDRVRA